METSDIVLRYLYNIKKTTNVKAFYDDSSYAPAQDSNL